MDTWFRQQTPRFECTACGACCCGNGDEYVFLEMHEAMAICDHLGLSRSWFRRHYLMRLPDGELSLRMRETGECIFLQENGRCGIYDARPVQCRTYPFWPDVMASEKTWREEAARCEGIDRGERVPLARIEAALELAK